MSFDTVLFLAPLEHVRLLRRFCNHGLTLSLKKSVSAEPKVDSWALKSVNLVFAHQSRKLKG